MVRLEGTNADKGSEILNASGLNIIAAQGLTEAALKIIEAVEKAK